MGRDDGFTLIELLVVIAIIAILAAILFPIFIAAKGKGQQAACIANMRQISSGIYAYLSDYNDTFPPNRLRDPLMSQNAILDGSRYNWKTATTPYIKNRNGVWRCQTNPNSDSLDETGTGNGIPADVQQSTLKFPISYAYNGDYFNQFDGYDPPRAVKLADIPRPTKLILICESVMETPDIHADFAEQRWASYRDFSTGRMISGCRMILHSGKMSNFIFADTHARASRLKAVYTPVSMWYPGRQMQGYYDGIASHLAEDAL